MSARHRNTLNNLYRSWVTLPVLMIITAMVIAGCGKKSRRNTKASPDQSVGKSGTVSQQAPTSTANQTASPVSQSGTVQPGEVKSGKTVEELAAEPYASGNAGAAVAAKSGGRTQRRLLYSFESKGFELDGKPVKELMRDADAIDFIHMIHEGATDGKWCARVTVPAGVSYGNFRISDKKIVGDWSNYDYFAMDVYTEDEHPYPISFELFDKNAKNYATRCTQTQVLHPGHQTLLFPINRAKRNNKEGREWNELEPKDKIDMKHITAIKIFTTPRKDRPEVFFIDNLRLLQEDAAKPKMRVPLPKAVTVAFDFGSLGAVTDGFTGVSAGTVWSDKSKMGLVKPAGVKDGGKGWPDPLAGTFVHSPGSTPIRFRTAVPNGTYRVWLCAGPVIRSGLSNRTYMLMLNDKTLVNDTPTQAEFDSEKYMYRFLWTQYSRRPNALWLDYINVMYPMYTETVTVTNGVIELTAVNYFLSAMIIVPDGASADFDRMAAKIRLARMAAFDSATYIPAPVKDNTNTGGDYTLYSPVYLTAVFPDTVPSQAERGRTALNAAGARGENVFMRVAVRPNTDLGECELRLSDLTGDAGTIPASAITGHYKNYRYQGRNIREMILLPSLKLKMEKGITQCYWLWLTVPPSAAPGTYKGTFTFVPGTGKPTRIPVTFTVYPFALKKTLPIAFGMYYSGRNNPAPPKERVSQTIEDQMRWMRRIGMTTVQIPGSGARVRRVDYKNGVVTMAFNDMYFKLARAAGLAASPEQRLMVDQLGLARRIAKGIPQIKKSGVDQNPGIEMTFPEFKTFWMKGMTQFKTYLDSLKVPYAVQVVDEPREMPNPWNRNLEQTSTYGDWMGKVGLTPRFITPMGDKSSGKDYTPLIDHADIISTHATSGSKRFITETRKKGKTLWIYNSTMSRFTWGFYIWGVHAVGRWEWHWSWSEGESKGGYPGAEWYNPFTSANGYACNAPIKTYPGGFLYKTSYLTAADGITDYTYIATLTDAIAANKGIAAKKDVVRRAKAFLDRLQSQLPLFCNKNPKADAAVIQLDAWRAQIAQYIKELTAK